MPPLRDKRVAAGRSVAGEREPSRLAMPRHAEQHRAGKVVNSLAAPIPIFLVVKPPFLPIGRCEVFLPHIFEIDLPAGHGRRALQRLMDRLATLSNPLMGFEETGNGLARGNRQLEELERRIVF